MSKLSHFWPQPLLAAASVATGVGGVVAAWVVFGTNSVQRDPVGIALLAIALGAIVACTQSITIHVRQNTKTQIASLLTYLIVVLLPVPAAATAVLLSVIAGEFLVRRQRGTYLSDIATQAGRVTAVAVGAAFLAHIAAPGTIDRQAGILAAAGVLWAGDVLTLPALICPITGEKPRTVIMGFVREAGALEAALYLVGILGAEAALQALWSVALLALPLAMVYAAGKRNKEMQDSTRTLLENMADTVDLRDPYTGGHSRRVTEYTRGILGELALQGPDVDLIVTAARVHDIGKIGVPDTVLLKDGQLDDEERAIMNMHPEKGAELLRRHNDFGRGAEIVLHHHERWDGEGYPHRLRGTEIPFGARVIAIADSFDAMTSDRPYRRGMSADKAARILREGRGRQWDGAVVDAFLRSIGDRLTDAATPHLRVVTPDDARELQPDAASA
jgi:HD-GYP domain-containing protein (c-di-GMP phosphodiesterase class II)